MNKRLINNAIILCLVVVVMILAFFVVWPILVSIIFGLFFAYLFHPIFERINKKIKNRNLSAFILMILLAFLIIFPIIYFTPTLIVQSFRLFENFRDLNIADTIMTLLPYIEPNTTAHSIILSFNNIPGKIINNLMDEFFNILVNLPSVLLQFFVFFFTFFYTLKDSERLKDYFNQISPFSKTTDRKILKEFRGITNSVILGQFLIGIIQGLALGLGLWILGVSNVLTWTIITVVVSIIPIIGPWLIWIPLSISLLVLGMPIKAIILVLYGGLFVSNIDNILRSYMLSRYSQLPVLVSLIGTIGGLYFLGILGLIIGPLILAYALIIIDFYKDGKLDELFKEEETKVRA